MTYKLVPYELLVKQLNLVLSSILPNVCHPQCDQILQNFAHFGKSLQVFEIFFKGLFLICQNAEPSLLWQICVIIGLIFNVSNGKY